MCGIVAFFSHTGPVSATALDRATRSLYHRGPDGQRHWIAPDGRVARSGLNAAGERVRSPGAIPSGGVKVQSSCTIE